MPKRSFGFLIFLRRMKRINIHEHSGGLVCQGLDLSWLNVMTCLLARDSIYPGWMSCRACLPGNRFFQVECHAGFACQGLDLSRLNVMPGLTRHLSLIFQPLRSTTIFFKAIKRLYHPFGVLVFVELFTFIIMPPLRGYVSTTSTTSLTMLPFDSQKTRWAEIRIAARKDLSTVDNYATAFGDTIL